MAQNPSRAASPAFSTSSKTSESQVKAKTPIQSKLTSQIPTPVQGRVLAAGDANPKSVQKISAESKVNVQANANANNNNAKSEAATAQRSALPKATGRRKPKPDEPYFEMNCKRNQKH